MGPTGQKNKILNKYFKNRKGLQKMQIKHVPSQMPPKMILKKNQNFEFFQKRGVKRFKKLKFS